MAAGAGLIAEITMCRSYPGFAVRTSRRRQASPADATWSSGRLLSSLPEEARDGCAELAPVAALSWLRWLR